MYYFNDFEGLSSKEFILARGIFKLISYAFLIFPLELHFQLGYLKMYRENCDVSKIN